MAYESYASYDAPANSGAPTGNDIAALTNNASTSNGTSNYLAGLDTTGSTGALINSSANPITTNSGPVDASGGNGSIPNALQGIATQGLNDALVSASEFGLGSLTDILRVSAGGTTTAASAPSPQGNTLTNARPAWLMPALLVGAALLVFYLVKK